MKRITCIVFLAILFLNVNAQHTVSGIITDKNDKTLLIGGVQVYIPEFERIDYSKEGGTYILRNVGIGTVGLQFTRRGYESIFKIINTSDSATVVNVEMEPSKIPAEEVSDISFRDKLPSGTPFPVNQYSSGQYMRKGNSSFLNSLAYEPGIETFSYGAISKIMIRGLSMNHVALYQDGSPVIHNSQREYFNHEFIEDGTSILELVKGPASLIYGENAMGGVLVLRDEKMPDEGVVNGDVNLGFFTNTVGLNLDAGFKGSTTNGVFYSVRFGGKSHGSYIQGEGDKVFKNTEVKEFAYHSGFNSGNLKGMFGISKKWGQSRLTLSYLKSQYAMLKSMDDTDIAAIEENVERKRKFIEPFIEQALMKASSENIFLVNKSQVRFNLSGETNGRDDLEKYSMINADLKYLSDLQKKFGFTLGGQVQVQSYGNQSADTFPDHKKSGGGVYLLVRYDLPKVNLLAGGRIDSRKVENNFTGSNRNFTVASGSLGLAYHPSGQITVKLNGSSGFSIPEFFQMKVYNYNLYILPDQLKDFQAEKNYEGDFEFRWKSPSVSFSLNTFYNFIQNYYYFEGNDIFLHAEPGFGKSFTFEQADARITGGEAAFSVHPSGLKWIQFESTYSMQRGKFVDSDLNLPFMPADKLTAFIRIQSERMNYLHRPYFTFGIRNYFKQERPFRNETLEADYLLMDVRLGGTFLIGQQEFDFSVSVNNFLNEGYYSPLSRLKYLKDVPVRQMGRSVALQFRVPFGLKRATK